MPIAVHGWTHTVVGALAIAAGLSALAWRLWRRGAFAAGFFAGTLTHVALDSLMHHDLSPLWPWRDGKPVIDRADVNISAVMMAPMAIWLVAMLWRVHRDQLKHPERGWGERLMAM